MHSESGLVSAPGSKPPQIAEKTLPEILRWAARREAEKYLGAFNGICAELGRVRGDGIVDLWCAFCEDGSLGATQDERVLGLLLLAEVLETAE